MKKLMLIIPIALLSGFLQSTNAQIPDDTDGRLYRLCKTWGYVKYFSQHKCELQWDTLLNTTVNDVLVSNTNEEFNDAILTMLNKVGNNEIPGTEYPLPDTNLNFDNSWITDPVFSEPVQDFLTIFTTHINPDTSTCLVLLNDYSTPGYYSYIDFSNDNLFASLNLTEESDRLTYMFYYWNIINYFFPYRGLMDQSWDSTLMEFIPEFRQVSTVPEFHITFLRLATKINDSHGSTSSSVLSSFYWGGSYLPKILFKRVDSTCVVAKVEGITGVSPGDILIDLEGMPINVIEDSLVNYIPASTPAALYRDMYTSMIRGAANSIMEMTLKDSNNNVYSTETQRHMNTTSWYSWAYEVTNPEPYYLTSCNYGYVNMGLLMPEDVPGMYESLKDASAIIFDLRNYPNNTLWDIGPLLFEQPIISAIYHDPALTYLVPPYQYYYYPGWYYVANDYYNLGTWFNPDAYDGNVFILVNEETQSQAEYTCQYFSFHPNAKVFGTQSAGADGGISYLMLPGGITTCFTSYGWYYSDGYQQQRNGVRIDTIVSPTIEGIRQGKDEILLAALDCLTGVEEQRAESIGLRVYPNPAGEQLTVGGWRSAVSGQRSAVSGQRSAVSGRQSAVSLSIVDLFGREVLSISNISSLPYQINISDLPDGVYILKITDVSGNESSAKFMKVDGSL